MFGCTLTPKAFQTAVNLVADGLLINQLKIFIQEILVKIQQLIKCTIGIDITVLLKYLTILAVLIWLWNFIVDVFSNYLCWFKSRKHSSSSSSSSSSDDSDDCGCE